MSLFSHSYSEGVGQLLREIKRYLLLERRYWTLDLAEKMAQLLTVAVLLLVGVLLGGIAVLIGALALAFWIGGMAGSMAVGFLAAAGAVVLVLAVVCANRRRWIAAPIARLVLNIISDPQNDDDDDE